MDPERLVRRLKPIDYSAMQKQAYERKLAAQESLSKYKQLKEDSKSGKEANLLKQHRLAWHKEMVRLKNLQKKLSKEIQAISLNSLADSDLRHIYTELDSYSNHLDAERDIFKTDTVEPMWMLREDLQYFCKTHCQGENSARPEDVAEILQKVKAGHLQVLTNLEHEENTAEEELQCAELQQSLESDNSQQRLQTGIPPEAWNLDCHDDEVKVYMLQEFILLDQKYQERLDFIEERYGHIIKYEFGGWKEDDHKLYEVIAEEYWTSFQNKRHILCIDRLQRTFPKKTRKQLVDHDEWATQNKHYIDQRRTLVNSWIKDRKELFNRVKVTLDDALQEWETEKIAEKTRHRQNELNRQVKEKIEQWRADKLEAIELEQAAARAAEEVSEKMQQAEDERTRQKREADKQKIRTFQEQKRIELEAAAAANRRRLEELRERLEEQAEQDRQRVAFRDKEAAVKQEEARAKKEIAKVEEDEKEKRLEALRLQVRPQVEQDSERLVAATAAWKNRQEAEIESDFQQSLFKRLHTYNDRTVLADPRVRLDAALREAGLQNSEYARAVMAQVAPPQAPRKDMTSTVFKNS